MKINRDHIEDLYAFTRKHFVEWYDLQTELVDHLANDVEAIWKEHPTLSYKEARDRAFKKFGVFGFMDVIAQSQNAMSKTYIKYLFSELKKWFQLPQILTTIALFLLFFISFSTSVSGYLLIVFYTIIALWSIYKSIQLNKTFKKRKEISNKKWMLEEMIFKQAGGVGLLFTIQLINIIKYSQSLFYSNQVIIGVSLVATLLCLINYISFELIPNKAEKLLNETYPEYAL